ncbi:hypothetical protein Y032_0038g3550 [Ancylostoma ceylanicum]|uniref:Uncharacterized protein n=1 Tax=Ancylostoma ceylanicum TaxID=53326 RepID=A0A016UJF3_9BILA|nr:hypothetical protein Y032_0038g3550 [Ancylostoma ceylanicum]
MCGCGVQEYVFRRSLAIPFYSDRAAGQTYVSVKVGQPTIFRDFPCELDIFRLSIEDVKTLIDLDWVEVTMKQSSIYLQYKSGRRASTGCSTLLMK